MGTQKNDYAQIFMKCHLSIDGTWREVSSLFCQTLGYSETEIKGNIFSDLVNPEDRNKAAAYWDKIQRGELREFESQLRFMNKSGSHVLFFVSCFLIRDSQGNPEYILCTLQNLSREKELQEKLEKREQQFDSLFGNNPHPVYYFDLEGNFEGVNDKLVAFTGKSRDELLNMNFEDFIVEEDLGKTKKHFQKAAAGETGQYEIKVIIKGGVERDIRVTKFPKYAGDEVVGVFGILQDITKEKKAKRELEKSEQRWQQLVEQNPQPVQIVQNGKIVFINQVGAEYYGAVSPDELIGKPILDFSHPDFEKRLLERKEKLEKNIYVEPDEHKILLLNGEERFIEAHSIPIIYKDEPAIQTVIHDITDLKEKQDSIGKSLREKETMLKEIHHRVKNNLAVISSMLELQIMQSTDESAINALRDSQLRIRSIGIIHEKLYQNESLYNIVFDGYLKELVQTIKSTYGTEGKVIEVLYDLDSISLDINQVIPCSLIVNEVVVNSFKHAFTNKRKGKIEITLKYENPEIELIIADDGEGLPADFNMDEQQSLGMTLIQALSNQLEGTNNFSTDTPVKGTTFRLRFEKNAD